MAVTNFRASDFPTGKKNTEGQTPEREDNKILDVEVDKAVRDAKEGEKYADDFAGRVDDANKKLNEEISNTEVPLDEQPEAPKKASRKSAAAKKAEAAEQKIEDEVAKASEVSDDK